MAVRHVTHDDYAELTARTRESAEMYRPWIPQREATPETFAEYIARCGGPTHEGFVICLCDTGGGTAEDTGAAGCSGHAHRIVGAVNINNIVRGTLQCGALGYVSYASTTGRGYMTEGLGLVIRHAFDEMGLHRLEANIQPGNVRSSRLVERLGFRREGHSPAFQLIDGEWRDHDRWAITSPG
ncbi:GNAT family N-acetyltransferase [Streptomyces bathyalis]|uniref:GNAT family N-acetyltransferase n=1 Tax=Streptomyces bathyalis TaxID=2710756 RepID=UPI003CCDF66E